MLERFSTSAPTQERLAIIQTVNSVLAEYSAQGYSASLRQVYYQFVARNLFPPDRLWSWDSIARKWVRNENGTPNAEPNYKWLGEVVTEGRMAGLIDWNVIQDRGRAPVETATFESAGEAVEQCAQWFYLDKWADQPNHVEVMVEKAALEGVLIPVCKKWQVIFTSQRGYGSASIMYRAGKRMQEKSYRGKNVHVLYFGDLDPSGTHMTEDVRERLRLFSQSNVYVHRVALNQDQVKLYNPPPNPAKMTDSRYRRFAEQHGDESYELDALSPSVIANLAEQGITAFLNADKWKAMVQYEHTLRERIVELAESI